MNHLCMPSFSLIVSSIGVEVGSFEMELLRCDRESGTGCRVEKRFLTKFLFASVDCVFKTYDIMGTILWKKTKNEVCRGYETLECHQNS